MCNSWERERDCKIPDELPHRYSKISVYNILSFRGVAVIQSIRIWVRILCHTIDFTKFESTK